MRVDTSSVAFMSGRNATESYQRKESLRAWVGEPPNGPPAGRPPGPAATASISRAAHDASAAGKTEQCALDQAEQDIENDPKLRMLIALVKALTGEDVRIVRLSGDGSAARATQAAAETVKAAATAEAPAPQRVGWGAQYDLEERYAESEVTTFSAEGIVRTSDGKEIRFAVELTMARQYVEEHSVHLRAGDAKLQDPLVINFNGTAAQLTGATFAFDINADGTAEKVPVLGPGSGFIAFDRNANGAIDDGSELIGATSGNGFAELAALDIDHNGWIDESDPAYEQLKVWTKDANGGDALAGLRNANVGAISVGSAPTRFDMKDSANQLEARVQQTGVYLKEGGGAGTVQQIDVAI